MSVRHRWQAWCTLLEKYRCVFRQSWRVRRQLTPVAFSAQEAEFLPAALSLQARPVSPAGRWLARVLLALLAVLLLWATLGRMDIIVNAQGKVIPTARTKTIASVDVARVSALHVQDGQAVKQGQLLIELDPRMSASDHDKAQAEVHNALLQAARSRALLAAIAAGQAPQMPAVPEVPLQRWQAARGQLQDHWQDFVARQVRFSGEIERYSQLLPLAAQKAADFKLLAESGDVARHAWLEKEEARIQVTAQLNDARNQQAGLTAETRKNAQDEMNAALHIIATARQDARRAEVHGELLKLVAPVDGTVQQLAVHTVGGVVPSAQALMQVVPRQGRVEMEAFLENRDVGFVREGQPAAVKIDTFDYARYGTVAARVIHVSRDAIPDEKRGLVYSVRVQLDQTVLPVDGRLVALTPGMTGSVEIRTGSRRPIEYVLSPLIQHARESLNER
jgi:hemolysin D